MRSVTFQAAAVARLTEGSISRRNRARVPRRQCGRSGQYRPDRRRRIRNYTSRRGARRPGRQHGGRGCGLNGRARPRASPRSCLPVRVGVKTRAVASPAPSTSSTWSCSTSSSVERSSSTPTWSARQSRDSISSGRTQGASRISPRTSGRSPPVSTSTARASWFDAEGEIRLTSSWTGSAYFSLANGRAS